MDNVERRGGQAMAMIKQLLQSSLAMTMNERRGSMAAAVIELARQWQRQGMAMAVKERQSSRAAAMTRPWFEMVMQRGNGSVPMAKIARPLYHCLGLATSPLHIVHHFIFPLSRFGGLACL